MAKRTYGSGGQTHERRKISTQSAVAADESNGFEGPWLVQVNPKPDDGTSYNVLCLVIKGGGIAAADHATLKALLKEASPALLSRDSSKE